MSGRKAGLMTLDPIGTNVCPDMEPVILLIIRKRAAIRSIPMEKEGSKRSYLQSRRKEGIYLSGVRLYEDGNHSKTSQHTYDAGTITKQATYTAAGEKVYTCTVCGTTKTEVIPMLTHEHNFTWTVISKATVFAPEKQEGICSICGAKQSRE